MLMANTQVINIAYAQTENPTDENVIVNSIADLAKRQATARHDAEQALAASKQKHADDLAALNTAWGAGEISSQERERNFNLLQDERNSTDELIRRELQETLARIQEEAEQIAASGTLDQAPVVAKPEMELPCIIGAWVSNDEIVSPKTDAASFEVVDGSFELEITDDGNARITYDDYDLLMRMNLPGISQVIRGVFSGTADGHYRFKGPGQGIAIAFESEVTVSVFRERGGNWQAIGASMDKSKHSEGDYEFACEGDILTLTSDYHTGFDGAYTGHLSRKN